MLALDGDVSFKPDGVRLLVDLMKKNNKLGAACGRVHPIGAGSSNNTLNSNRIIIIYLFIEIINIYILNTIQMDPSRSHRFIHVINNCEGQYNTNSNIFFLVF